MNEQNDRNSVFITGANGGLGMETIKWLIEDGYRNIVMASRSKTKAEEARRELLDATGGAQGTTLTSVGGFDMTKPALIEKPNFASATELRQYALGDFNSAKPYNPMNAIGVS